jgi:hypothetical protein
MNKIKFLPILALFTAFSLALLMRTEAKGNQLDRPAALEDRGPLEKVTFIHYRRGFAKPPNAGGGKGGSACYAFIARGAKWKTVEDYVVNPGYPGLDSAFISAAVEGGVAEWENYGGNIFGQSSLDSSAGFSFDSTDDKNVLVFGAYADPNVIGVTNVWGYFAGPPQTRALVEWDMLLNTRFSWGDGGANPNVMDLQNIVTHELGHSAGLADLYEAGCNLETMFGYSSLGEITKRTLNAGDILGIQALY